MTTAAIPTNPQDLTKCNNNNNSGIGLLTTVAQLPAKYKIRYLARTTAIGETPLDLTVKPELILIHHPATTSTSDAAAISSLSSSSSSSSNNESNPGGPITPPPSPPKKRYRDLENFNHISESLADEQPAIKLQKTTDDEPSPPEIIDKGLKTPTKPIRTTSPPKTSKSHPTVPKEKKSKAIRKLKFDEDTSSPVSGTIIRPIEEILENADEHQSGDIDPQYNIVEITDEAKSELAAIKNVIGAYVCKLCRLEFDDAFGLAQHRCSCIVLLEYRCPECGKRFNCPANLASHRRWHKPKEEVLRKQQENSENEQQFPCDECGKLFKRQAYLRKHLATHKERVAAGDDTNHQPTAVKIKRKLKSELLVQNQNSRTSSSLSSSSSSSSGQSVSGTSNSIGGGIGAEESSSQSSLTYRSIGAGGGYNDNRPYKYDSDLESRSDCSSPGRLQIIENNLTEEENIAAAALAHLRNGPSVIQHTQATTMAF